MSKLMDRLAKLEYFSKQHQEMQSTSRLLKEKGERLDQEWVDWIQNDLGMEGNVHIADVMKKALETSIEQSRIVSPHQ